MDESEKNNQDHNREHNQDYDQNRNSSDNLNEESNLDRLSLDDLSILEDQETGGTADNKKERIHQEKIRSRKDLSLTAKISGSMLYVSSLHPSTLTKDMSFPLIQTESITHLEITLNNTKQLIEQYKQTLIHKATTYKEIQDQEIKKQLRQEVESYKRLEQDILKINREVQSKKNRNNQIKECERLKNNLEFKISNYTQKYNNLIEEQNITANNLEMIKNSKRKIVSSLVEEYSISTEEIETVIGFLSDYQKEMPRLKQISEEIKTLQDTESIIEKSKEGHEYLRSVSDELYKVISNIDNVAKSLDKLSDMEKKEQNIEHSRKREDELMDDLDKTKQKIMKSYQEFSREYDALKTDEHTRTAQEIQLELTKISKSIISRLEQKIESHLEEQAIPRNGTRLMPEEKRFRDMTTQEITNPHSKNNRLLSETGDEKKIQEEIRKLIHFNQKYPASLLQGIYASYAQLKKHYQQVYRRCRDGFEDEETKQQLKEGVNELYLKRIISSPGLQKIMKNFDQNYVRKNDQGTKGDFFESCISEQNFKRELDSLFQRFMKDKIYKKILNEYFVDDMNVNMGKEDLSEQIKKIEDPDKKNRQDIMKTLLNSVKKYEKGIVEEAETTSERKYQKVAELTSENSTSFNMEFFQTPLGNMIKEHIDTSLDLVSRRMHSLIENDQITSYPDLKIYLDNMKKMIDGKATQENKRWKNLEDHLYNISDEDKERLKDPDGKTDRVGIYRAAVEAYAEALHENISSRIRDIRGTYKVFNPYKFFISLWSAIYYPDFENEDNPFKTRTGEPEKISNMELRLKYSQNQGRQGRTIFSEILDLVYDLSKIPLEDPDWVMIPSDLYQKGPRQWYKKMDDLRKVFTTEGERLKDIKQEMMDFYSSNLENGKAYKYLKEAETTLWMKKQNSK